MYDPTASCPNCGKTHAEHIFNALGPDGLPTGISCWTDQKGTVDKGRVQAVIIGYNILMTSGRTPSPAPVQTPPVDQTVVAERTTMVKQVDELAAVIASQKSAIAAYTAEIGRLNDELEAETLRFGDAIVAVTELKERNAELTAHIAALEAPEVVASTELPPPDDGQTAQAVDPDDEVEEEETDETKTPS